MRVLPVNPAAKTVLGRLPFRLYGVALVLLGMLLASYFLLVLPKNRAMAAARNEIENRRGWLQLLEVEMTKLENSRRRVQHLEKAISAFEDRLPREGEVDVILREVWLIADASGLKTQRIKTQKSRRQGPYNVLPIEMSLQGPFEGLYRFLLSLERLPGLMNVESLRVRTTSSDEDSGVQAGLVLNVFCKR